MKFLLALLRYWFGVRTPRFVPAQHLRSVLDKPGVWRVEGNDPIFGMDFDSKNFPTGWVIITISIESLDGGVLRPCLYIDDGAGYREETKEILPLSNKKGLRHIIELPTKVCSLRFDPTDAPCSFHLGKATIRPVGRFEWWVQLSFLLLRQRLSEGRRPLGLAKNGVFLVRQRRFGFIRARLLQAYRDARRTGSYASWIRITEPQLLNALPQATIARLRNEKRPPHFRIDQYLQYAREFSARRDRKRSEPILSTLGIMHRRRRFFT